MADNKEKNLSTLAEQATGASESAAECFAEAESAWESALDTTDSQRAIIYALRGHSLEIGAYASILAAALYGIAHYYGMDAKPSDLFDAMLGLTRKAAGAAKEN